MQVIYRNSEQEERASDQAFDFFVDEEVPCYLHSGLSCSRHHYAWEGLHQAYVIVQVVRRGSSRQLSHSCRYVFSDDTLLGDAPTSVFDDLEKASYCRYYMHGARKPTPIIDWSAVPLVGQNLLYAPDVVESPIEREFREHLQKWSSETGYLSSATQIVLHPSYQRIIGMGPAVLPLIFHDLQETQEHDWFWALVAITGENPVDSNDEGNVPRMVEAWRRWGKEHGYL